jgi:8-oxo-dGTP diphosphatase
MADLSDVTAAGGILWQETATGISICVVHRPHKGSHGEWSLPKGRLDRDRDEHPLQAAVREVAEETGVIGIPQLRMPKVRYGTRMGREKVVQYWSMSRYRQADFQPNEEVAAIRWLPTREAYDVLTCGWDRAVVGKFVRYAPVAHILLLVRVAGRADAERLADVATTLLPTRLIADANHRCIETLTPLATRTRLRIEQLAHVNADELRRISRGNGAAVVCTTGTDVDYSVAKLRSQERKPTRKGEGWFLSFTAHGDLVGQWRMERDDT